MKPKARFFILALSKRYVQIKLNKLKFKNKILPYYLDDNKKISNFIIFFICINFICLLVFLIKDAFSVNFINFMNSEHSNILISIDHYIFAVIYSYLLIDLFIKLKNNLIQKDFYNHVISSFKYSIFIGVFFLYTFAIKIL